MTLAEPSYARAGAIAGLMGVAGNVLGVAVLGDIPSAYRPTTIARWTTEVMAAPGAATASGVAFTLGMVALALWSIVAARRLGTATAMAGGVIVACGALLNAAGTLAPAVVAHHLAGSCAPVESCVPAGTALLGLSLSLDALFNLLLGLGLIAFAPALWRHARLPRWLAVLALAGGVASMPVSLQIVSDRGADLLAVAGPLWLAFISISSLSLWRGRW